MNRNKKGFTLAELLVVVAIIAVLAAISIPIFSAQLEKARESVDMANLRDAYAVISAAYLTEDDSIKSSSVPGIVYDATAANATTGAAYTASAVVTPTQRVTGWQSSGASDHTATGTMNIGSSAVTPLTGTATWTVTMDTTTGSKTLGLITIAPTTTTTGAGGNNGG